MASQVICVCVCVCALHMASLCSPGWPGICSIDQAGLCLPSSGIKSVLHYHLAQVISLVYIPFAFLTPF